MAGLPVAAVPLWQVAQVPTATPVWLNNAPRNDVVLVWQVSQPALVTRWLAGLDTGVTPANEVPLWQVAQPVTMPVWLIVVPVNDVVDL